jgi:hypothetical protein
VKVFAVPLVLAVGATVATLAPSAPAAATPPGGRCVGSYYQVQNNYGLEHQQVGATEALQNASSVTVNLTASRQVSQTFTSTVTVSGGASVSINLGIVSIGVQTSTSMAVAESMSVNTTTSVTVPVPPQTTMFAAWGVFLLHTSGPYTTITVDCDTGETIRETSVNIDAFNVVTPQPVEGWRVWS